MSSASSSLTGFVQLQGPITTTQLDNIKDNNYPFLISFAPRSTIPTLVGNRIDESTGVTGVTSITYKVNTFTLVDVQICPLIHTGYALPGNTDPPPVSELILSFNLSNSSTISNSPSSPKAILVCIPIYNSGTPSHSNYLTQLVNTNSPVSTLKSLFYASDTDTSQVSLSYPTTFYTVSSNSPQPIPNNIYIAIFPTGITMTSSVYQVLLNRIGSTPLPSYQLPPAIRGGDSTVTSYNYNSNGRITVINTSVNGNIPTMQVSTCTDDFTNNFVYYTQPPRIPSSSSSSSSRTNNQCPYYQTTQYKCVPFNQLKDLSGQYVIPGVKTLNTILGESQQVQVMQNNGNLVPNANGTLSTADIEGIVAGVAGGIIVLLGAVFIGSWISKNA